MTAALKLEPYPSMDDDPVLRAVRKAPMGPPLSTEERAAVEEGERYLASGQRGSTIDDLDDIVARMRAEQGDTEEP